MKNKLFVTIVFLAVHFGVCAQYPTPSIDPHWQLIWSDDFDGTSIDVQRWDFSPSWGCCSDSSALTSNGSNHVVSNNKVSLITKKENSSCFHWTSQNMPEYFNKSYSSGCLYSKDAFKYGFFEIRSKIPANTTRPTQTGQGLSPCFWLFPNYYFNLETAYSEIDIYEIRGRDNTHTCNVHFSDSLHPSNWIHINATDSVFHSYWSLRGDETYTLDANLNTLYDFVVNDGTFHTYAGEWNSQFIRMYYDNNMIRGTVNRAGFDSKKMIPMNVFVTNTAYSSNFGENISTHTILPYNYVVDYVKIYQLRCDDNTEVNEILNFNTYYYAVKKSITMSNLTTIPSNTTTCLRAKDFIQLNAGFEVPLGSTLYLTVSPCDSCLIQ